MPRKRLGSGSGTKSKSAASKTAVPGPISPSRDRDYQAEDDFRTLERSEEVRGDAARHTRAVAHGRKKMSAMARVVAKAGAARATKRARPSGGGRA